MISVVVGLMAAGAAAWLVQRKFVPPISVDDPRQVARGASVYAARCAQCHGANLEGQPDWQQRQRNGRLPAPPHDAGGHTWHHPDEILFGMTKNGMTPYAPAGYESDMPAFSGTLTDDEIAARDRLHQEPVAARHPCAPGTYQRAMERPGHYALITRRRAWTKRNRWCQLRRPY